LKRDAAKHFEPDGIPKPIYLGTVRSLYSDGGSMALGSLTVALSAVVVAVHTGDFLLYIFLGLMICSVGMRLFDIYQFNKKPPPTDVTLARSYEIRYIASAALYMAILGCWTLTTFIVTDEIFFRFLAFTVTTSYALGIATRNFSSRSLTNAQIVATIAPLCLSLLVAGGYFPFAILLVLVPLFLIIKVSAERLRSMFLAELVSKSDVLLLASRFDTALNNMSHGLCMFDARGRLVVANREARALLDLQPESEAPQPPWSAILAHFARVRQVSAADARRVWRDIRARLDDVSDAVVCLEIEGRRVIEITVHGMQDRGAVFVLKDVTDRRDAEAAIYRMAHFDAVTGLANRSSFEERLNAVIEESRASGERAAMLFLDLDDFKQVNDTLGHGRGDRLLTLVAERLIAVTKRSDIVARWGGDEFVILQRHARKEAETAALANLIIEKIGQPFDIDGYQVVVGVSVGVASTPRDANTAEELLRNADMALYAAKADGRGRWRPYQAGMDSLAQARRMLELDLRKAVATNALDIHYQPLVAVADHSIVGFEALARWRHPTRGWVSPAEFIPVAEDLGLIVDLGRSVLNRACVACASWPGNVSVSVNLSALQIHHGGVVEMVKAAIADAGLAPDRLEIEVTESALIRDPEACREVFASLKAMGVRLSLDDFGAGYSNLSYLHELPFDKVKLDRSFARDLGTQKRSAVLIDGVARIGAMLGIVVLVEGVETDDQLRFIEALGSVSQVQGYLFSKAVPEDEAIALLGVAPRARVA
jgi:diguanylate cyclase (GGDEF)-like protein